MPVTLRVTRAEFTVSDAGTPAEVKTILWEGQAVFPDGVEHHRGPISLCTADDDVDNGMDPPRAALRAASPDDSAAIKAVLALDVQRVIDEIEDRHANPSPGPVSLI